MPDNKPPSPDNLPNADRPLECTECKKSIAVLYTEIVGDTITHTMMCADCPELQKRLHGTDYASQGLSAEGEGGLACGNCGTSLSSVKRGNVLGCNVCYDVFGEALLVEMLNAGKLPQRVNISKKSAPLHIGRGPGETQEINPSIKLLALNEALTETLKREDYEQAAWLRDQIKELTENMDKPEKKDE